MTANPRIVHVRSDVGSDTNGDGTPERPYRTYPRAKSDHPDAHVCLNDVLGGYQNLTPDEIQLWEETEISAAKIRRGCVLLVAIAASVLTGYLVQDKVGLAASFLVLAVAFTWFDGRTR